MPVGEVEELEYRGNELVIAQLVEVDEEAIVFDDGL